MKERLDKVIEARAELILRIEDFKMVCEAAEIEFCGGVCINDIHVYSGIEKLANILCCEIETVNRDSEDYPTQVQFTYGDILFYELKDK